jgi:hypothetical protein
VGQGDQVLGREGGVTRRQATAPDQPTAPMAPRKPWQTRGDARLLCATAVGGGPDLTVAGDAGERGRDRALGEEQALVACRRLEVNHRHRHGTEATWETVEALGRCAWSTGAWQVKAVTEAVSTSRA